MNMRHFYAGTFINRKDLKKVGIEYPIKLEYYKTKIDHNITNNEAFGIEIVKTAYTQDETKTETANISEFTRDETMINRILDTLRKNEVTPISANEVVEDLLKAME